MISVCDFRWAIEKLGCFLTQNELDEILIEFSCQTQDKMDFD